MSHLSWVARTPSSSASLSSTDTLCRPILASMEALLVRPLVATEHWFQVFLPTKSSLAWGGKLGIEIHRLDSHNFELLESIALTLRRIHQQWEQR